MSKKPESASPAAAPATVRVRVRLKEGRPEPRCRAGLTFARQYVNLDVSPAVRGALMADPQLEVREI